MKKSAFFWMTMAILGLATVLTKGQPQSSTTTTTTTNYVQTSRIVGMKVKSSAGEEIGTIKDVVLDRDTGCMLYTVLSTGDSGTRLTGTTKTVAVPWKVYSTSSDPSVMIVTVERERIYNAPAFEYSRINEYSTSTYISNVYSYYGIQPSVGVGVGISGGGSAGISSQTNVSAQTNATATASPSMTPAVTASPSVSVSPSATAKARPTSSAAINRSSASPSASVSERRSSAEGSTASPEKASSPRAKRRVIEDSEVDESSPAKPSKRSSPPAEASPTP